MFLPATESHIANNRNGLHDKGSRTNKYMYVLLCERYMITRCGLTIIGQKVKQSEYLFLPELKKVDLIQILPIHDIVILSHKKCLNQWIFY